ncbi:hypothetical protein [Yersinia ruckeri]|uniref:hypothetical protein n=1 Tax=Yersinia ruckeri TaxID=29486 RepID=UPI0004E44AFF|nr:hypothetical protein [Yersinia ruckeri]ARZ00550.1 hypothetical protein QMA0440_01206 [Yersinia ruckeri]KFE37387.1 hypothetical protein nADLYRO1b_3250 [Yersinia ruckeri]MCK8583808.1 hypothetical protein [Yersinia ruckeri]MCW6524302.1 hypothetical protein [Yersinia ruckeri]MCW6528486.1 hypothetical protein [Yersinia ruckeri]
MGVQGLAEGFLAGFNTADQAVSRHREWGLRDAAQKQQVKDSDRNYGLAQEQVNWRKEIDNRDHQYKTQRDSVGDEQWNKNYGLAQANQRTANASLGMRAQALNMRKDEFNFQRSHAQRQQRMQEEMPVVQALYQQIETSGQIDPQLYQQISQDNPLHPARFFGQDAINNVMEINRIMPKVLSGEMNYNDPQVLTVMNRVLAPHIGRNVDEVDPQTGKTIKSKELSHIGITEDGNYVVLGLTVTYSDGTTANKPMTQFGSADEKDNQVAQIPIERFMRQVRGYSQMVGQLNQPDRAKFIASMVNPPDYSALKEEAKGLRKDLLDIGKARAKAISEAPDKEAAATINKQYDQLEDQINESYGKPTKDRITPVVQQWTGDDQTKAAFVQNIQKSGALDSSITSDQLDNAYKKYTSSRGNRQTTDQQDASTEQTRVPQQNTALPTQPDIQPQKRERASIQNDLTTMKFSEMSIDEISDMRNQISAYKNDMGKRELIHLRANLQRESSRAYGEKSKYLESMLSEVNNEISKKASSIFKGLSDLGPQPMTYSQWEQGSRGLGLKDLAN